MPDATGQLTGAEQQIVRTWIQTKWKNWVCPFSGDRNWNIGEHVLQLMPFTGGGLVIGGPIYPYISDSCIDCGFTFFLNALQVGVLKQPQPTPAKPAGEPSSQEAQHGSR